MASDLLEEALGRVQLRAVGRQTNEAEVEVGDVVVAVGGGVVPDEPVEEIVLLVKLRSRLLGPITTLATTPTPQPTTNDSEVEAAFRQVDLALNHLCITLGLTAAA